MRLGATLNTFTTMANGEIQFESTIDAAVAGGSGLSVSANGTGQVLFQNAVGDSKALSSFSATGSSIEFTFNSDVTTTGGGQTYNSPVILAGTNFRPTDSGTGAIDFISTVDSASGSPGVLVANTGGVLTFGGAVGGSFPLSGLIGSGGSVGDRRADHGPPAPAVAYVERLDRRHGQPAVRSVRAQCRYGYRDTAIGGRGDRDERRVG